MGKASRWMVNFLLGKKEAKNKKKDVSFYEENVTTPTAVVPSSPSYKRRWSFGKSSRKERVPGRNSISLDSINTTKIAKHGSSLEQENQQNNTKAVTSALATTEAIKTVVKPTYAAVVLNKAVKDAAATRIQAAFRSYLARKALCALKGLVKLQALVRGNLVRKQTTATLRQMHALMAIQVRARFQRIQMAEESQLLVKSQSSRHSNFSPDNVLGGAHREVIDVHLCETSGVLKNKSGDLNQSELERIVNGTAKFYSTDLSILKRQHQYKEFSFSTAQNSPQIYSITSKTIPGRASFTCQKPDYAHPLSHQHSLLPNYMANTESSKARVRSQSEPKQRPKWSMRTKNKQRASMDGMNVQQDARSQCSPSSHSKCIAHEDQDPWLINLYQSTMSKDGDYDTKGTTSTSYSNYSKFLATNEPHLNLY